MRSVVRNVLGREIMMRTRKDNEGKRQYSKPVVVRFPLKAEEAVLGFCKSSGNNGPGAFNCTDPINGGVCQFPGS